MQSVVIENENARVVVRPDLGGGLATFELKLNGQWVPVMRGKQDASWFNDLACYVLAPWSNRIRDARFEWQGLGNLVQLKSDWPDGTAIHGDVKAAAFTILDRSPQSVRLKLIRDGSGEQNWPWKYECIVRYQLDGRRLTASVVVKNTDVRSMPCGLGLHPFFPTQIGNAAATVRVPVAGRYPCEGMMPVAEARDDQLCQSLRDGWKVEGGLDDIFTMRDAETNACIEWPGTVRLRMDANRGCVHAVIYSGESTKSPAFFCVELVTNVNDGFNLLARGWQETDVEVLGPGEEMQLKTVFEFERF